MAKEAVFTMKLEPELRDAFMADAAEIDRPASQIMRELMKDYLQRREQEKREYKEFLRRKVELSKRSIAAGQVFTNDEVEREMNARVADLHLWRLGPGHEGLIVSLVSPDQTSAQQIKAALRRHYPDLSHVTVEVAICADCA